MRKNSDSFDTQSPGNPKKKFTSRKNAPELRRTLKDNLIFLREFFKENQKTGTIWPTSPHAARALSAPILEMNGPRRILELGPGTGSVTVQILEYMSPEDELVICEINPRFMAALKENLQSNPRYQQHRDRVTFLECGAQDLPNCGPFDVVVCALPFLNFSIDLVRKIFQRIEELTQPKSVMTFYEYIGMRSISRSIAARERKERIQQIEQFYASVRSRWPMSHTKVWLNMLPIFVYRIELHRDGKSLKDFGKGGHTGKSHSAGDMVSGGIVTQAAA